MLQTYKILNKIDDVDYHTWFSKIDEHHQKTRQAVSILPDGNIAATDNLVKPKFKLDIRKNFFSCRVVDPWNNLPEEVRRSEDVVAFKKNYDAWLEVRSWYVDGSCFYVDIALKGQSAHFAITLLYYILYYIILMLRPAMDSYMCKSHTYQLYDDIIWRYRWCRKSIYHIPHKSYAPSIFTGHFQLDDVLFMKIMWSSPDDKISSILNQFAMFPRYKCYTGFPTALQVPLLSLLMSSSNVTLTWCSWRNKRSSPTQPSFKTSFKISRISYREILLSDGTGKRFFLGNSAFHLNLEFSEILEDEPEICFTWLVAYFYCWSLQVLVKIKWSLRKRPIWTEAGQLLRSCFFSTIAGWRANPNPKFLIKIISKIIYKHFPKVKTKFSLSIHSISKLSISYLYLSISHSSQESIRTVFKHRQR